MAEETAPATIEARPVDTGLLSLCLISRFLGTPAESGELARRFLPDSGAAAAEDLVRIAGRLGLKARIVRTQWDRLAKTPLPAIAENRDGTFLVASRMIDGKLMVQQPFEPRARVIDRDAFEDTWTGRLILLGRRASL